MTRFGQQHRDQARRDAKAQMAVATNAFYVRPESGCTEVRTEFDLDDPDFRFSQRLVTHDNRLVEYALVLSRLQKGRWVEVYSVDTRHGQLHEHISGHQRKDDRRDIRPLYNQVDVQESIDEEATPMVLAIYRRMRS